MYSANSQGFFYSLTNSFTTGILGVVSVPHCHTIYYKHIKMNIYIYIYPIPSMYGIFTYIWLIFMLNVGKYTIHGFYGYI